ncbi:MAG: MBL fold metallo-hydrolase [Synergistaceae bacterium]
MLRITMLLENHMSEHKSLRAEHGLSMYIEYNSKKILFDFGASDAIQANAQKLGINLCEVDCAVCSHAHYDHAAGLQFLLNSGIVPPRLIIGDGFWNKKFAYDGIKYTYLGAGYDSVALEHFNLKCDVLSEDMEKLYPGCYIFTNFNRIYDFEKIPERFVIESNEGIFKRDAFVDEIALVFDTHKGLVVLVGCSHPGILNMLSTIIKRLNRKIYAVIGGSHLLEADVERINISIDVMKRMGIEITAFSHCSGELVNQLLEVHPEIKNTHLSTGDVLIIEN